MGDLPYMTILRINGVTELQANRNKPQFFGLGNNS